MKWFPKVTVKKRDETAPQLLACLSFFCRAQRRSAAKLMSTDTDLRAAKLHQGEDEEDLCCLDFVIQSNKTIILLGNVWELPLLVALQAASSCLGPPLVRKHVCTHADSSSEDTHSLWQGFIRAVSSYIAQIARENK